MNKHIKKSLDTGIHSNNVSLAMLFLRIIAGTFMLTHGYPKFLMLIGDAPIQFADPLGIGETTSLILTVFAEFICSLFLIFGLATRFSVIPLLIAMLVAAFIVHGPDAFGRKEMSLLFASIYTVIAIVGAGKYSLDEWLFKKRR